jgi:uncharacterized protein (TIGR02679 family)
LEAARARVDRLDRIGGSVELAELDDEEASALAGLLGGLQRRTRPRAGQPFRLPLRDLDRALLETRFAVSLPVALETIGPRLDPRPRRRARERAERDAFWAEAARHPLCAREPQVAEWLVQLRARGIVPAELVTALELGARLPLDPPLERTRLAADATGDPHALDDDRPLSRLVTAQLAARAAEPRPSSAVARRGLWQRFGVLLDEASTDVLVLGIQPLPGGPLAAALRGLAGWQFRLTLGQLVREPLRFPPGLEVFVCENVTVLSAAEQRLGAACPPLVCVEGWPSSAAWVLFDALAASGAAFRYHGDFDWAGLRIAALVRERTGAQAWRFDAAGYTAALERFAERTRPLSDPAPAAVAAGPLAAAMLQAGRELHEEVVLDDLLTDLAYDG